MSHDVFVSYSSYDKTTADAVCALLEGHGIRCWIAPRDILPGMSWAEAIIDALEEARVMVLVFSAKANASQQIQREVERAVHNGVTIVPLRIEDAKPSKTMEYFISTPHWLDALTPPIEAHILRLADAVKTLLSRPDMRQELSLSVKMRAYQMGQGEAPPGTGEHPVPVRPPMSEVPVPAPAPAPQAFAPVAPPFVPPAPPPAPAPVPAPTPAPMAPPSSAPPSAPVPAPSIAPPSPAPIEPRYAPPPPVGAAPAPAVPAPAQHAAATAAPKAGFSPVQLGAAAAVVVVVLAIVVGLMMRRSSAPAAPPAGTATQSTAPSAPAAAPTAAAPAATHAAPPEGAPAAAAATVVVDVAPWARVSIVPVAGGQVSTGELVTPVSVSLAPGEYDITLDNGGVTQALTRRVTVVAGQPNAFRFTMPGFTPSKVVHELRGGEVKP